MSGCRDRWDVIIVGAGPAGCAAAAALHQHDPTARVLLLDRSAFPRDKVCGDGIAHEAIHALRTLDFDTHAVFSGTEPVTTLALRAPNGLEVSRAMVHPVRVLPRRIFDARLVADIGGRNIPIRQHTVRSIAQSTDGVELDSSLWSRFVIAADGAESTVRRAVGVPAARPGQVALAIRAYAPEPAGHEGRQFIAMTARHWPAYAWSFPIGNGLANVGYGQLLGAAPLRRASMIEAMQRLLPGVLPDPTTMRAHRLPLSMGRPAIGSGRVLLSGDAQSLINPFTGEGIYYAITSGALAGIAVAKALNARDSSDGDAGSNYRRLIRSTLGHHFRHTSAIARLGGKAWLIDAAVRAAKSDQAFFDGLVRLGLADGLLTPRLLVKLPLASLALAADSRRRPHSDRR